MTPEEITRIVKEKAKLFEKQYAEERRHKHWLPEFTPIYRESVEMYERIRVHSQADVFPEKLFAEKAPNQVPTEWDYQKRVFKAIGSITHPYWDKALGVVNRIWNEKNYSIKLPEIESPVLEPFPVDEYFNSEYPEYGSIEAYFKSVVTRKKIEDPNAWLAIDVLPVESDTELPRPYATIWGSKCILGYKEDSWLLVKTYEKSKVKFGNQWVEEGIVMRMYDTTGIYRIEQVGSKLDWKFSEPILLFAWDMPKTPAWRLKGKPVEEHGYLIYQSYFYAAVPALNTAIIDFSTAQLSKIINVFPERWEYVDDCDAEGCQGTGKIYDDDHENWKACPNCLGTGRRNKSSVTNVVQVPYPKGDRPLDTDAAKMTIPPFGYVNKAEATEQIRLLIDEQDTNISRAFAMINMEVSNSNVKGTETALGKSIDREELFSFILQISNESFDLLERVDNAIGTIRYGRDAWKPVEIGYPQNFAIRSDLDLTMEIGEARKAGVPSVVIQQLTEDYTQKRFNNQAVVERESDLIFNVDRMWQFSSIEITQKVIGGICAKWEAILHDSIGQFINELEIEQPNFWEMDYAQQKTLLIEKAKAKETEIAPVRVEVRNIIEE